MARQEATVRQAGSPEQHVDVIDPWDDHSLQNLVNSGASIDVLIKERSRVHEIYIRETEKTRRTGFFLSAMLLTVAVTFLCLRRRAEKPFRTG